MVARAHVFVVFVVFAVVVGGLHAMEICNMNQDGLDACKPSVMTQNPVDPTPECCKAVAGADMGCLCSYRDSTMLPYLGIDPALAVGLPAKCSLPAPPC
ncbi:hypothetical protein QVD17_02756 [Tagetes erecta]|uniref:Bifunctional inhibitor/plant lipid transfer protein/seed storage helical domain-containing protein n=1 Tax=Tagetes erecta TaxID=13708 RepID=A0AAD8L8T1_TARER|nr:hypothetical protein QVD17_02756 [Tagetes erecta]